MRVHPVNRENLAHAIYLALVSEYPVMPVRWDEGMRCYRPWLHWKDPLCVVENGEVRQVAELDPESQCVYDSAVRGAYEKLRRHPLRRKATTQGSQPSQSARSTENL